MSWFRNHSALNNLRELEDYERDGGISEENPFRATSPAELWALVPENKALLMARTWAALESSGYERGVGQLPAQFVGQRKIALKALFAEVSAEDAKEWEQLSKQAKEDQQTRASDAGAVQG